MHGMKYPKLAGAVIIFDKYTWTLSVYVNNVHKIKSSNEVKLI